MEGSGAELTPFHGKVRSVRFINKENGFTIFEIEDRKLGAITVKGEAPPLSRGMQVEGEGFHFVDPKWGAQLQVKAGGGFIKVHAPQSLEGIVSYLAERVDFVGPEIARRLVKAFGDKTLEVIRLQPERVREVPGVGPARAEAISKAARALEAVERVMTFLAKYGIGGAVATKLHREYGERTMDVLQADPWVAADHIDGIGFLTADRMAAMLGMGGAHPGRIRAGLVHTLKQAEQEGHTGLTREDLIDRCSTLLELLDDEPLIVRRLDQMMEGDNPELIATPLVATASQPPAIFVQRRWLGRKEAYLAQRLRQLIEDADLPWLLGPMREAMADEVRSLPYTPSSDQLEALDRMLTSPVSVLTGGPGAGKTTMLGVFLRALQSSNPRLRVALCAPTGKAAMRMKESVGGIYDAVTTHRLLGSGPTLPPGTFTFNRDNPLEHDFIVADESSMYDTALACALVEAVDAGAALLLVGDIDQLPSIGPGAVFADLIASGIVPVSRLTTIHRQAQESQIIVNAHAINRGSTVLETGKDFHLLREKESEGLKKRCVEVYAKLMQRGFAAEDIMVLTAGHKAASGTVEMNESLRLAFNPNPPDSFPFGKIAYGVGDRVIVTKNEYTLDVRNGQLGTVRGIDREASTVLVDIDGRIVAFPRSALPDLRHGWCMTIHKAQGSQARAVILLLDRAHYTLLDRTLVYTGLTRAAEMCIAISRDTALETAVKNKRARNRKTALLSHLTSSSAAAVGIAA